MTTLPSFFAHDLADGLWFYAGQLPEELRWDAATFEVAWALHPDERPVIHLHGKKVAIPRWQKAYGQDYRFSGQVSKADPVPPVLEPLLEWSRREVHPMLNGLLLNWYEGPGHYIGPHRDAVTNMVPGAPIVTVSFGETRRFRLSKEVGDSKVVKDFPAPNGTVFVLPQETNAAWKHAVPKSTRYTGRRISVTIRSFVPQAPDRA